MLWAFSQAVKMPVSCTQVPRPDNLALLLIDLLAMKTLGGSGDVGSNWAHDTHNWIEFTRAALSPAAPAHCGHFRMTITFGVVPSFPVS